jgi:hypothetical protein
MFFSSWISVRNHSSHCAPAGNFHHERKNNRKTNAQNKSYLDTFTLAEIQRIASLFVKNPIPEAESGGIPSVLNL